MKGISNKQNDPANDYALAKLLNEYAIKIFTSLDVHGSVPDFTDVNRSYILLIEELKQIYARQPKLQKIGRSMCWQVIDSLEMFHENIGEYKTLEFEYTHSGADYGEEHNSKVSRLCTLAEKTKPDLTPQLQKLLDEADKSFVQFKQELAKMYATVSIEYVSGRPVVSIGVANYYLSAMRDGLAQTVISYCLNHHPDKQIDLKTLKSELSEAEIKVPGLNNLKENIRNSHFGNKKPLSPFVQASPKVILVRKTAALSDMQIDAIKLASS